MSILLELAAQTTSLDPLAATKVWMDTMTPEQVAKSNSYFEGGYWLILWNFLIGMAVAWLVLGGKRSARAKGWLASKLPKWLISPSYIMLYTLVTSVIVFPMTIYEAFFREKKYDLMNLSMGGWMKEQLIGLGLVLIVGTLAIWGLFALIRKLGPAWRWWGAGAVIGFLAFMALISPVFIAPLYNDYTPMEDGPLKTQILAMADANGVPADDVYVFNISKQTKKVTANVSGFMGTTRISLSDTLLERTSPASVKAVMGHEIGHYALGHIYEMLIYMSMIILAGFIFTHAAYEWARRKWGAKWGIGKIGDIAGLPLFIACLSVFLFVATPAFSSMIRTQEVEADIFGLNAAQEPDGFAEVAMMLSEYRKIQPGKWEEIIFFDHPSGYNRVLMSMRWKAANQIIEAAPKLE